jgi:dihydrofolate reductase
MPRLRVHNLSVSLDGFAAGLRQSLEEPLGEGGSRLHEWVFATRTGVRMMGGDGGERGLDDAFAARGEEGLGATIMGRNMFGPVRGPWADTRWRGWWGPNPPFHHPVFVLTHHAHAPIELEGGTTFHFVTGGAEAALERAFAAARGLDVRLGGGPSTVQQYLRAGLIDELHLVIAPVLLGSGERLFDHLGEAPVGYRCVELVSSKAVAHVRLRRA